VISWYLNRATVIEDRFGFVSENAAMEKRRSCKHCMCPQGVIIGSTIGIRFAAFYLEYLSLQVIYSYEIE